MNQGQSYNLSPNYLHWLVILLLSIFGVSTANGAGYDIPYYGGAWSVIHRDNRNSDFAPYPVANYYAPHHQISFKTHQIGFNKPTIGLNNNPFLTGLATVRNKIRTYVPYFFGLQSDQSLPSIFLTFPEVDPGVAAATALIGHDGGVYLTDHRSLMKYSRLGKLLWRTPIRGNPISGAHFTMEGDIFFFSWNGWFYVVSQEGDILVEQNLTPERNYSGVDPAECAIYGNSAACAFANTAAFDPIQRRMYQMLNLEDGSGARIIAYHYPGKGQIISPVWEGPLLEGGSAASITLSPDYHHLYTTDREGHVLAVKAESGQEAWRIYIGFVSAASPVVSQDGYLMPAANRYDENSHYVIIKDEGSYGRIVFSNDSFSPETNAAAGLNNRFVTFGREKSTGDLKLLVIHPLMGILGESVWGGKEPQGLLGVSLDSRGWVYVSTMGTLAMRVYAPYDK